MGLHVRDHMMRRTLVISVVVVLAVTGISTYALSGITSTNNTFTVTQDVSSVFHPACPTMLHSSPSEGYNVNTYVSSTSPKIGDHLCIDVAILYVNGRNITIRDAVALTIAYEIIDTNGHVFYQTQCSPTMPPVITSTGSSGQSPNWASHPFSAFDCGGEWDTAQPVQNTVPGPGTYHISVQANVPALTASTYSTVNYNSTISLSP